MEGLTQLCVGKIVAAEAQGTARHDTIPWTICNNFNINLQATEFHKAQQSLECGSGSGGLGLRCGSLLLFEPKQ
jgi:hypothetical protein